MNNEILKEIEGSWNRLVTEGKKLTFKKGQVIFYQGHQPYGIFVLEKGTVSYTRKDENGDEVALSCDEHQEHEKSCLNYPAGTLPKGRVIGLGPFIKESQFCCTCQASEDCEIVFISKTQLGDLTTSSRSG